MRKLTKRFIEDLTYEIIGAAIEVHKELGPGLLEKVYEACLKFELEMRGFNVKQQQVVPINFKGYQMDAELKFDLLVEDCIIVENKAVSEILPVFEAQVISHSKLLKVPKGILLNFHCTNIVTHGRRTFVNEYFRALPDE